VPFSPLGIRIKRIEVELTPETFSTGGNPYFIAPQQGGIGRDVPHFGQKREKPVQIFLCFCPVAESMIDSGYIIRYYVQIVAGNNATC
jgi:hypothetical protein